MEELPHLHAVAHADVAGWLARLGSPPFLAVDTETAGYDPLRDRLRSVQVAAGSDVPVLVLDADHVDPRALAAPLGDPRLLKVFHHGAFDLRFLWQAGLEVQRVADTMLAQQLLDGGTLAPIGNSLAQIAGFRLGVELDKSVRDEFASPHGLSAAAVSYAATDAAVTWAVFDQQWRELKGHGLVRVAQLEFAALPALAALQHRGVGFDPARWHQAVDAVTRDLPRLEAAAQEALVSDTTPRTLLGPEPVNLDSPDQVTAALARLGVDVESTSEQVLRDHADVPAVAALLAYRQAAKVASNWGGDWAETVRHPVSGRIHADWRQIVGSGRVACSDPNLTQVPAQRSYRRCFVAGPGRVLVVADYSQQELRILAATSGDHALTQLFRDGRDLHRATAALVFGVPEPTVSATQRKTAKALNFGLMYGMGARGFAAATGMDLDAARQVMRRYFDAFPKVEAWLRDAEATARRSGRVRTPLGRLRAVPGHALATYARNAPIQGAGADMIKLALADVARRLGGACQPDGPVLVVHDELVVDVPQDRAEEAAAAVVEAMVEAAEPVLGEVPAEVDVAVRPEWG